MSSTNDGPAGSPRLLRAPVLSNDELHKTPAQASAPTQPQLENDTPVVVQDPPTMGWQSVWWKILHWTLPHVPATKPGKKELLLREEAAERLREEMAKELLLREEAAELAAWKIERRQFTEERMRHLSDQQPSMTVAYVGVKGAAATTTTMVNGASIRAEVTRTTVYGADFNPASGTAGGRLGKNFNETISLREFGNMIEELGAESALTKEQVNARLRPTRYGVRVLIADDYTLQTTEQFGTRTKKMLDVLKENCDYLEIDTANDITTPASRAVLEKADVIVFTANVRDPDTLRLLYTSMEKVRQLGLRDKVANSVVVISNLPNGDELENYMKYLDRTDLDHVVIQRITKEDFQGQFLGVPHDDVIAKAGRVDLEAYDWATRQAYTDLVNAEFEQALKLKPAL